MTFCREKKTNGFAWKRAVALLLALTMVLIPVNFPGKASAVEQDRNYPYYIEDAFDNDKYS